MSLHTGTGFPVGKVDVLKIFPIDFAEFVLAVKGDNFYDILTKDIQRILQVWNSIPQQLAKENKKFVYGAIRTGARAKSLRQFVLEHEGVKGIRISMSKYREQDWMTNIPLYAAGRFAY
ncbi:MAG: hypothetical protein MJY98_08390 [Fibrobacter sp.]|nr:hypothetical protein [Fibrobacter sp.]